MKNFILVLSFLLLFLAIHPASGQEIQTNPIYKNNEGSKPKAFLVESDSTKVDFIKVIKDNFSEAQKKRIAVYMPIMNRTLASSCFEKYMLQRKLIQTNGKSPQEVVDHIRSSTAGVELISYWSRKGTVGYTYPNVNKIWMNERLHKNFDSCRSASNLAHEGSHKIGYGHDYKRTSRRPYSVPYSINAAFKACCSNNPVGDYDPEPPKEVKKKLYCKRMWWSLWIHKRCYRR